MPWKNAQQSADPPQNERGIELRTLTPGETTSGLTRKSTSVGPWLEKPAMMFELAAFWKYVNVAPIVTGLPSDALTAPASARLSM